MNTHSVRGFTLVEIMIVVVIIGLLAAMALPAFQKVRSNSISKMMENDARQLASAAQQYLLENAGVNNIIVSADTDSGALSGPLGEYVKKISKGTSVSNYDGASTTTAFTMANPQLMAGAVYSFNSEGKKID